MHKSLVDIGRHIIFTWIPCHIGINWNAVVDQEATEQVMNLHSEDAMNFKARSIALASAIKIELADSNRRE
jgi:hypothetical protein